MSREPPTNKPTGAYILTLITAIINIILAGVLFFVSAVVTSTYRSYYYVYDYYLGGQMLIGIAVWVLIAAIILIVAALKLNSDPWEHSKWGIVILVFSIGILSILGIIGGILALTYTPEAATPTRMCIKCGRTIEENTKFCPFCGNKSE